MLASPAVAPAAAPGHVHNSEVGGCDSWKGWRNRCGVRNLRCCRTNQARNHDRQYCSRHRQPPYSVLAGRDRPTYLASRQRVVARPSLRFRANAKQGDRFHFGNLPQALQPAQVCRARGGSLLRIESLSARPSTRHSVSTVATWFQAVDSVNCGNFGRTDSAAWCLNDGAPSPRAHFVQKSAPLASPREWGCALAAQPGF